MRKNVTIVLLCRFTAISLAVGIRADLYEAFEFRYRGEGHRVAYWIPNDACIWLPRNALILLYSVIGNNLRLKNGIGHCRIWILIES